MNVLITGASGFIGQSLVSKLREGNHHVRVLTRGNPTQENEFQWNPNEQFIDEKALENLDAIIHLAGANISKRWTKKYKKELFESRINTANLLKKYCQRNNIHLIAFISASGVNCYGTFTSDEILNEDSGIIQNDFLSKLCAEWEQAADQFSDLSDRVVCLRTALVLGKNGGVFPFLRKITDLNLGAAIGSGKQWMNWIHLEDLVNLYVFALEKPTINGKYNAVADDIPPNKKFMKTLARTLCKFFISVHVPAFLIKLMLGQMSIIILHGSRVSNKKIKSAGFDFQYDKLQKTFKTLI